MLAGPDFHRGPHRSLPVFSFELSPIFYPLIRALFSEVNRAFRLTSDRLPPEWFESPVFLEVAQKPNLPPFCSTYFHIED
jgi:hypothetical protein